jgi:hypothetical protein
MAPYYLLVEDAEHGAMIFKAPGGYDDDEVVITSVYTLQPKPMLLNTGMTVVWGAGEMVIDCKQHRWHQVAAKMLNLERTQGIEIEGAKFDPFAPIKAGTPMAKAEALLCQKRLDTGLTPINDLTAFAREHKLPAAAQPKPVAAAPAPAPALRAAAASPARPPQYRMAEVGKDGATLIDRASITRQGDVVSFRQLHMLAESGKVNGMDYWWADVSVEADCKLHRTRLRVDDFLSLDRRRREVEGTPKFNPWDAAKPGSEGRAIEDFVCRGKGEKDFEAVPDVDKFRSDVMGAIKAGVFKE